jgi:hypothetical protein
MDSGAGLAERRGGEMRRREMEALLSCTADVIDRLSWARFVTSGALARTSQLRRDPSAGRQADVMWESAVRGVAFAWRLRVRAGDTAH